MEAYLALPSAVILLAPWLAEAACLTAASFMTPFGDFDTWGERRPPAAGI